MGSWDGIDEFVAVCDAGSFSGGAKLLNVSKAHVSRSVAALEQRIGSPLLLRNTRQVTLTLTGEKLAERCRAITRERDDILDVVTDPQRRGGHVRITSSPAFAEQYVAPVIASLMDENPYVSYELDLTNRVVDIIAEGYDIAIRVGELADSRLVASRLTQWRAYLCAAPRYYDRRGKPQTIEDLAAHDCLLGTNAEWIFRENGVRRTIRPKGRLMCNNARVVVGAALAGYGLAFLPAFYAESYIREGLLTPSLEDYKPDDEIVSVVHAHHKHVTGPVRTLVDRLRQTLRHGWPE